MDKSPADKSSIKDLLTKLDIADKAISTCTEEVDIAMESMLIKWKLYALLRIFGDNSKFNFALRALNKFDKNINLTNVTLVHRLTDYFNNKNTINALIRDFDVTHVTVPGGVNALLDSLNSLVPEKKSWLQTDTDNNFDDEDWRRYLQILCLSKNQAVLEVWARRDYDTTIFYRIGLSLPISMRATVIYSSNEDDEELGVSGGLMGPPTRVSVAGITETIFHTFGLLDYGQENFKCNFMYDPFYDNLTKTK